MRIPIHLQIEIVNNLCTARCIMCTVFLLNRKPNILTDEKFVEILTKFKPYRKNLKYLSLTGQGETLLDKNITKKVKIAKDMGFNGVGFPTNCTELNESMSKGLIVAGLDTIICSIDGIKKETHEAIRIGINFDEVVSNVKRFIEIRDNINKIDNKFKTKIIIRFINQNLNKDEWIEFYSYWKSLLNKELGDDVIKFDVHDCGGKLKDFDNMNIKRNKVCSNIVCKEIFERLIIFSDGNFVFCCGDTGQFPYLGSIFHDDPIEIYNNELFSKYRKFMKEGKINELEFCKSCTIALSRS